MGFFSALFGGSNSTLNKAIPQAGQASQFATGMGEGLVGKSGNFLSSLMSGDPTKSAQLLAPQIGTIQKQAQQGKNQSAQFGGRSGGTAAQAAGMDAATRGGVSDLIAKLTGTAVGQGMEAGKSLMDSGMNYLDKQVEFSQQQMENWSNSIFGQSMAQGIGFAEKAGMSAAMG